MAKHSRLLTWKLIVLPVALLATLNAKTPDVDNALTTQDSRQTTDRNSDDDVYKTTPPGDINKPTTGLEDMDAKLSTVIEGLDNRQTTEEGLSTTTSTDGPKTTEEGLSTTTSTDGPKTTEEGLSTTTSTDGPKTTEEGLSTTTSTDGPKIKQTTLSEDSSNKMTTPFDDVINIHATTQSNVEDMLKTTIKDEHTWINSSESPDNRLTPTLEVSDSILTTSQSSVEDSIETTTVFYEQVSESEDDGIPKSNPYTFDKLDIVGVNRALHPGENVLEISCQMYMYSGDVTLISLSLHQKESDFLMEEIVTVIFSNNTSEVRWLAKEMEAREGVTARTPECSKTYCELGLNIEAHYTRCEDAKDYQCVVSALTDTGPLTIVSFPGFITLYSAVAPYYTEIQREGGDKQEYRRYDYETFICTGSIGSKGLKHKWQVAFKDDPCSTAAPIVHLENYYIGSDGCNKKGFSKASFHIPDVTRPIVVWCWVSDAKTVAEECDQLTENNLMKSITILPAREPKRETQCSKSTPGTYIIKPEHTTYRQNDELVLVCRYNNSEAHGWYFRREHDGYWTTEREKPVNNGLNTTTLIIPKLSLINRGWFICKSENYCHDALKYITENQTVFVDVLYEPCRENGILIAGDACVEIMSASSCAANKGNAASILTAEKSELVHAFAFHVRLIEKYVHIGLNMTANTLLWKNFVWADGSPLTFMEPLSDGTCPICWDTYPVSLVIVYSSTFPHRRSWALPRTQEHNVVCEWKVEREASTGLILPPSTSKYSGSKAIFRCTSGEYITSVYECDGTADCIDISDEANCDKGCVGATFQCDYGGCVSVSKSCDFIRDCVDGSDEINCNYPPCGDGYWQCANKECIPVYDVCDGDIECIDGSDEADALCIANSDLPTDYTFRCFNPDRILPLARNCDGVQDCLQPNDERCGMMYFSCSEWAADRTTAINIEKVAVDYGMSQYGILNVQCTTSDNEVRTTWDFSQKQDIETPYQPSFSSDALWFETKWNRWQFQSIFYQSHYQQQVMLDSSSTCVQYIRPCAYFLYMSGLVIEWTNGNGDTHHVYLEDYGGCFGMCTPFACSVAFDYLDFSEDQHYDGNEDFGWIPITDKRQLPVTSVRANYVTVMGVSHLICSEDLHSNVTTSTGGYLLCKNEHRYDATLSCLMDFDLTGEIIACRDLTHLENCENFTCPKDYVKCPDSFCLHMRFICDGTAHCPHKEDELDCESTNCSNHYRCRGGRPCVPFTYICDGVRHCPLGDDELLCDVTCPMGCTCQGLAFECDSWEETVYLKNITSKARWISMKADLKNATNHFPLSFPLLTTLILKSCSLEELTVGGQSFFKNITGLRHLDVSSNLIQTLPDNTFDYVTDLRTLVLSNNPLVSIPGKLFKSLKNLKDLHISHTKIRELNIESNIFSGLSSLEYLDLSANLISRLPNKIFSKLITLQTLILRDNPLVYIDVQAFSRLYSLSSLQLSNINSERILSGVFSGLQSLTTLNLSSSGIHHLGLQSFQGLTRLEYLDIQNNYIEAREFMFDGLDNLQYLYADTYKMCCIKPKSVPDENCFAPADLISSCSNLIGSDFLRVCLWIIGFSALFGNIFVIIYRLVFDNVNLKKSQSIFIINLSISDLIMGIYMILIASVDTYYSGKYVVHDSNWRQGTLCVTAGCLSVISSEMSTFAILMITIDRFMVIVFPLSLRRITWKIAVLLCLMFWIVSVVLAIVPETLFPGYFKGEFYSRSGVCLALPLTRENVPGQEYSVAIFIGLNGLLFLLILIAQICIQRNCKGKGSISTTANRKREIAVARSLFLVVATDFLCWFPVGVLGMWSQLGGFVSADVYAWVMVFVLPINSAINPFLYTYIYIRRRQKMNAASVNAKAAPGKSKDKMMMSDGFNPSNNLKMIHFSNLYKLRPGYVSLEKYARDQKISPTQAYQIASRVLKAVWFLHQRDIIHGNVSDRNVYTSNKQQSVKRASLLLDPSPIGGDQDSHTDILQYGLVVKKLLSMVYRH